VNALLDCSNFASGWEDISSRSMDMLSESSSSELSPDSDIRRRFLRWPFSALLAHDGRGYSRSNCCCKRLIYSVPFTRSSASAVRSFLSRGFEAKDTTKRSSSLSIQAGASSARLSVFEECRTIASLFVAFTTPLSMKKSC
jgi:hypothetical protein